MPTGANVTQFSAAGTTQATATPIPEVTSPAAIEVTTVPSNGGIILPALQVPTSFMIANDDTNTLNIYPPLGGTINNGTVNAAVTLAAAAKIIAMAALSSNGSIDYYTH